MRRLLAFGLAAVLFAVPAPATAAEPLPDIPFAIGVDSLFDEERNDGQIGIGGLWELMGGRLANDALHLRFRIRAPSHEFPVVPGPAVLFGGLRLSGDAGGDMGAGENVDSLTAVTIDPCEGLECRVEVSIALPLDDLGPAIRRLERVGRLTWVSAELTLVRTFAGGTWLQVLPFMHAGDGALEALTGRLGAIEPTVGRLYPYGLFRAEEATRVRREARLFPRGFDYAAAVEDRRKDAADRTKPLLTAPATLTATMDPLCEYSLILTVHDQAGNRIFDTPVYKEPQIEGSFGVPVDVPLWLTLHDVGGMAFDRFGWGTRVGPVATTGAPIAIDAAFDCSVPSGVVRVNGAMAGQTAEPSSPTPVPASRTSPSTTASASIPPASTADAATSAEPALVATVVVVGLVLLAAASWGWRRRRLDH